MVYSFDMRKQLRAKNSSRSYVTPWYEKEPDACRFFDIPVYDQAEDAHYRMKEKLLAPFEERAVQRGGTVDQGRLIGITGYYHSEETSIWRFNHIIGWIDLRAKHDVVKGYLWWAKSQKIYLRRKEGYRFREVGRCFDVWVDDAMSSTDILRDINDQLSRVSREEPVAGRFVDRTSWDIVSSAVDWRTFLGWQPRLPPGE